MSVGYSIIIPAFNEATELPKTLASVLRAMAAVGAKGECIVVDNNSTDRTAEIALKHGATRVVAEPVNQIARARNAGAAAAQGPFLVFIDADTRIDPELLVEALRLLKEAACVGGGSIIRFEGEPSAVGRFGIRTWERISLSLNIAAGSFIFCRRDAFDAIGGYDETLYASEEVRFSRLLKKWGRAKGFSFKILKHAPVATSARKLEWYSGSQIIGYVSLMLLLPIAVRSRRLCKFWYERPAR